MCPCSCSRSSLGRNPNVLHWSYAGAAGAAAAAGHPLRRHHFHQRVETQKSQRGQMETTNTSSYLCTRLKGEKKPYLLCCIICPRQLQNISLCKKENLLYCTCCFCLLHRGCMFWSYSEEDLLVFVVYVPELLWLAIQCSHREGRVKNGVLKSDQYLKFSMSFNGKGVLWIFFCIKLCLLFEYYNMLIDYKSTYVCIFFVVIKKSFELLSTILSKVES